MHVCSWGCVRVLFALYVFFCICACIAGVFREQTDEALVLHDRWSVCEWWLQKEFLAGEGEPQTDWKDPGKEASEVSCFRDVKSTGTYWYQVNSNIEKHNSIPVLGVSPLFNTPDSDHQLITWELHKLSVSV